MSKIFQLEGGQYEHPNEYKIDVEIADVKAQVVKTQAKIKELED